MSGGRRRCRWAREALPYAGFLRRALALLIDLPGCFLVAMVSAAFVGLITALVGLALGITLTDHLPVANAIGQIVLIIAFWLYFAGFESSRWQATPGKRIVGLRVTGMDGERIGLGRASRRLFFKILSSNAAFAGFLRVFVADNRQAFHDAEAGTLVLAQHTQHRQNERA